MKPAVLLAAVFVAVPLLAGAQEVQTSSETLQAVLMATQSKQELVSYHLDALSAFFTVAVESGALTEEQAMLFLDAVGWGKLVTKQAAEFAVRALELALAAVITGKENFTTLLEELDQATEAHSLASLIAEHPAIAALPELVTSSIKRGQELSRELLVAIEEALESGVSPGRIHQTLASLTGASEDEIEQALDELVKRAREHHKRAGDQAAPAGNKGSGKGKPSNSGKGKGKSNGVSDWLNCEQGSDNWPWCRFAKQHWH